MRTYDLKRKKRLKALLNLNELIHDELENYINELEAFDWQDYGYEEKFAELGRLTLTFYKKSVFFRKPKQVNHIQ
jgi:hypothetical protein